ncbi:MAG: YbaN family protein [Pseudomonadota bacterium]
MRFGAPMRVIWLVIGCTALLCGTIGIVLPVLPTTPFVILAAFAFTKAWPSAARKLESHRVFGPIIADWRAHGAIALRYKIVAHVMMIAALGLSLFAGVAPGILAIQIICMSGASLYILSRPSGAAPQVNSKP